MQAGRERRIRAAPWLQLRVPGEGLEQNTRSISRRAARSHCFHLHQLTDVSGCELQQHLSRNMQSAAPAWGLPRRAFRAGPPLRVRGPPVGPWPGSR